MRTEKILVFGGSFDPPHKYHLEMLKKAKKTIKPDKIIIVPTFLSPFKKTHLTPYNIRKKMIKILLAKNKIKAQIDDFENKRKKKTYTYELGRYLKKKYPDQKFYFLMGSDALNSIEKWKRYKEIFKIFKIVVAIRKDYPIKKKNYPLIVLKGKFENLSSTEIRKKLFISDYSNIDKDIKKYIFKNGLYFSNIIKMLKKLQTPKRFNHSLLTTKLSIELSVIHKCNLEKTVLAGLIHDITKDMNIKKQIKLTKKTGVKIKNIKKIIDYAPEIIHQWASAGYAITRLKIKDKEVLSAIKKHTTGNKKMSLLDKIIYVADISSKDRNFKESKFIRDLARKDIDKAYKKAREVKIAFVKRKKGMIYE